MKKLFSIIFSLMLAQVALAQKETIDYAVKDGQTLKMDVYSPGDDMEEHPCILFFFGGGYISGSRTDSIVVAFCETMAYQHGFVTIAVDYRLGLVGDEKLGVFNTKPLDNAINMAAEDAISAVSYTIEHSQELAVDTSKIILSGSSSGAITSVMADYLICNGLGNTNILPEDFHLAGVISFSGALYPRNGKIKYKNHSPAPTMFMHGMKDGLVPYDKIKFFSIGFFGSDALVEYFDKKDYPYYIRRYENYAHVVAQFFNSSVDKILWFYENYIEDGKHLQIDEKINYIDDAPNYGNDMSKSKDLYN